MYVKILQYLHIIICTYHIIDNILGNICILKKGNRIVNCNAHIKLNLAMLIFSI